MIQVILISFSHLFNIMKSYLGGKSAEEREPEMAQCKCEVLIKKIPGIISKRAVGVS